MLDHVAEWAKESFLTHSLRIIDSLIYKEERRVRAGSFSP